MRIFKNLFKQETPEQKSGVNVLDLKAVEISTPTHRYPPIDRGFTSESVDLIIQSQAAMIDKIKVSFGISESSFNKLVMPVIRNYATYIHLLPATSNEHHRSAGGLFRLGLEVGFYALQSSSGVIFSNKDSSEKRRLLQPKWTYATFVAGLCCELYKPVSSIVVVDDNGLEWPQLMIPLYEWLVEKRIERYYIRWNEPINGVDVFNRHSNAAYLLNKIIPQDCLQYMHADKGEVITAMTATITGAARPNTGNMIYDLVFKAQSTCINEDMKANPEMYGRHTVGTHMEPYLIDAMRELYKSGKWKVNEKGARLWYAKDGLFCVWGAASKEIKSFITSKNLPGIPDNEDTLADILMNASVLIPNSSGGGPYWEIFLPETGKLLSAVRIVDPSVLSLDKEVKPLSENITSFSQVSAAGSTKQAETSDISAAELVETKPKVEDKVETKQVDSDGTVQTPKQNKSSQGSEAVTNPVKNVENIQTNVSKSRDIKVGFRGELFKSINEDSKNLLGAILDDYISGESEYPVFYCEHGLAISMDEFNSHGVSELIVIKEIAGRGGSGKGWLITEQGSSKQFMTLKHDGKEVKAYVLNMQVASGLGFPFKKGNK